MEAAIEPSTTTATTEEEDIQESKDEFPVLHVIVVGFHHKKGCLVEYATPPLLPGGIVIFSWNQYIFHVKFFVKSIFYI